MESKNWEQRWVEKNPLIWKLICKFTEFMWFFIKVEICILILKFRGVI